MADQKSRSVRAAPDEKMIEVKVRFWTDSIAPNGDVMPKRAWAKGNVRMQRNETHGLRGKPDVKFNSLLELPAAIERLLIAHGVVLHPSTKMRKYVRDKDG